MLCFSKNRNRKNRFSNNKKMCENINIYTNQHSFKVIEFLNRKYTLTTECLTYVVYACCSKKMVLDKY